MSLAQWANTMNKQNPWSCDETPDIHMATTKLWHNSPLLQVSTLQWSHLESKGREVYTPLVVAEVRLEQLHDITTASPEDVETVEAMERFWGYACEQEQIMLDAWGSHLVVVEPDRVTLYTDTELVEN
tara:strand:+ start:1252 stop:1635 length:384 start_codon:yes stop_codon:yes gene_type:complete